MYTTQIKTNAIHTPNMRQTLLLWMRNYTTRKALRRLTQAQLADVGLSPEQANSEGRKWFWQ